MNKKKKTFHVKQDVPAKLAAVGRVVHDNRKALQLSLTDVAKRSGVTTLTISKLEKGLINNLSLETLDKICNAINLHVHVTLVN